MPGLQGAAEARRRLVRGGAPGGGVAGSVGGGGAMPLDAVVGTSAVLQPAASLPLVAPRNGARLVELNPAETALAHEVLRGPAAELLPAWWEETDPG